MRNPRVWRIVIPRASPLLNQTSRTNRHKLSRARSGWAWSIQVSLVEGHQLPIPVEPLNRAKVTFDRYSTGSPDYDGVVGGMKGIIDCLIWCGKPVARGGKMVLPHPAGLGFVIDDAPTHMVQTFNIHKVKRAADARTEITIEEILDGQQ